MGTNGTIATTTSDKTGYYKFVIPANTETVTYQKTGAVNFTLTDNAGNSAKIAPFSFTMDEEPPVVTPSAIVDQDSSTSNKIDVNGKVRISGTAVDTLGNVAKVYIKYIIHNKEQFLRDIQNDKVIYQLIDAFQDELRHHVAKE